MPSIVSLGDEYIIPDLVGLKLDDAKLLLEESGFIGVESKLKTDLTYPAGSIIDQLPKTGSVCKKGRRVYLTISAGSQPVIVPNFKTVSPQEAKYRIQKAKLLLDSVMYDYSSEFPEGVVMIQTPAEGETVAEGEKVLLTVSLGPDPSEYIVPDIISLELSKAIETIKKSGLKIGLIAKNYNEELLPNTIISQIPEGGSIVNKGSEVVIIISSLSEDDHFDEEIFKQSLKDME